MLKGRREEPAEELVARFVKEYKDVFGSSAVSKQYLAGVVDSSFRYPNTRGSRAWKPARKTTYTIGTKVMQTSSEHSGSRLAKLNCTLNKRKELQGDPMKTGSNSRS